MVDVAFECAPQAADAERGGTCAGLCAANARLLRELAAAIRQIPEDCYEQAGSHVRHLLDYYRCFLRGDGDGVDYQARLRDGDVEIIPAAALAAIERMVRELEAQAGRPAEEGVWVAAETGLECEDKRRWRSSRGRELEFLRSHSVHHMAIIRMVLKDVTALPETFGVAPSTLRYWASIGK